MKINILLRLKQSLFSTKIIPLKIIAFYLFAYTCLVVSCNNQSVVEEKKVTRNFVEDSVVTKYSKGVVLLQNSTDIKDILCQEWVQKDDADDLKEFDDNSSLLLSIRSFNFFEDGSFVKNYRSNWSYGNWTFNEVDKIITLNYKNENESGSYKITAIATDELNVVNKSLNTSTILTFVGDEKRLKAIADEPFHLSNNTWRVKPTQKETDAEIKQRLKNNLTFFALFYKSVIVKNHPVISFYGLPSCLKWYGGGIYLEKKEALNKTWVNSFYSNEQAMKAYSIMDKVMEKKYTWPKQNIGWVKKNLFVLEQMIKNLDAME